MSTILYALATLSILLGAYAMLQRRLAVRLAVTYAEESPRASKVFFGNAAILVALFLATFSIAGASGFFLSLLIIFAAYLANSGLHAYFGRSLTPGDLSLLREARAFLPEIPIGVRIAAAAALALLLVFVVWLHTKINVWIDFSHEPIEARVTLLLCAALLLLAMIRLTRSLPSHSSPMAFSRTDQDSNIRRLGFVWHLLFVLLTWLRPTPTHHANPVVIKSLRKRQENALQQTPTEELPDVILLMMESLADLTEIGMPLRHDPIESLKTPASDKCIGSLSVKVLGGNTCDTEFEVLTGIPIGDTCAPSQAYSSRIPKYVYALPHAFSRVGYDSFAVHPFHRWFYGRDAVYKSFGFHEFLADESFVGAERVLGKVSDAAFVEKVFATLSSSKPSFVFGVSIMGHGPYPSAPIGLSGQWIDDGAHHLRADLRAQIENYCTLVKNGANAIISLKEKLEERKRPFVLLVFGDHAPVFASGMRGFDVWRHILQSSESNTDLLKRLSQTPLVMWSNVSHLARQSLGNIPASDLGYEILQRIGIADPCAFGTLASKQLSSEEASAYYADAFLGSQELSGMWLAKPEPWRYLAFRQRYQSYLESQKVANALAHKIRHESPEAANRYYAKISTATVGRGDVDLIWATWQIEQGKLTGDVLDALDVAARFASDPFWAFYHRVRVHAENGALASVRVDARSAVEAAPSQAPELARLAMAFHGAGMAECSRTILEAIASEGADLGPANVLWAVMCIDSGDVSPAIQNLLEQATAGPDPFWAHYHLVRLHVARGEYQAASIRVETAAGLAPQQALSLARFAQQLYGQGNARGAQAVLAPLASSGCDLGPATILWAVICIDSGDVSPAIQNLLEQATAGPDPFWAHYHLVRLHVARGETQAAQRHFEAAASVAPERCLPLRTLLASSATDLSP